MQPSNAPNCCSRHSDLTGLSPSIFKVEISAGNDPVQILSSEGRVVKGGQSEHRTGTDAMMALTAAIPLIHLLLLLSAPSVEASNVHVSHLREDHR